MNQYTYTKQWAEKIAKQYGGTVHIQKYDGILVVVPRETTIKQILMDQGCTVRVHGDHYRNNDKTRYMKIFIHRGSSDRIMIYPFDARDYSEASIETTHHTSGGSNVARIKDKYPEIDVVVDESVFETLNKINDTESLSEKYNVKNARELKESSASDKLKSAFPELDFSAPSENTSRSLNYIEEDEINAIDSNPPVRIAANIVDDYKEINNKTYRASGSSLREALLKLLDRFVTDDLYFGTSRVAVSEVEQERGRELSTLELLGRIENSNGLGDTIIRKITDLKTGKTIFRSSF